MQIKTTEIVTTALLQQLDSRTWEAIALKAINKMPKHKLQRQSQRMFNDFVFMTSNSNSNNKPNIPEQLDDVRNINETLLVGSTKITPPLRRKIMTEARESVSLIPRQSVLKKIKNKRSDLRILKTQHSEDKKRILNAQKPKQGCLKLFVSDLPQDKGANQKMEEYEDTMRAAQMQSTKYSTRVMQIERERLAVSEQRTQAQHKKYKQLKAFTYDYQGRLMGSAGKNTGTIKVISIRSHFNSLKPPKHVQTKLDSVKMSPIVEKKVVDNTGDRIEQISQPKMGRFLRAEVTRNMTELFNDEKSVQMGVSITDMNTNSKLFGRERDRKDKKNYNLQDFKNLSKLTDGFKARTSMFVSKNRLERQKNEVPPSPHARDRIFTQIQSQTQSKLYSSTQSRLNRNRGSININNQRLFTETFHDVQR